MTVQPGTKLGPYEILSPLGAGGMGEVWKARDSRLGRFVAVKVLPPHLAAHPEALARFEREAKAVATLNHPSILALHDLGQQDGLVFAVMELLEGETLRAALATGALPAKRAVELAVQMAQGLAAAHAKGVVHRDLKPDNLWITQDGRLKILDFGLAKHVGPVDGLDGESSTQAFSSNDPAHTREGRILGTVGYMSPEQVRGEDVDARSDIFSFGAVLYEMLTGERAFVRSTPADTLAAILKEDPGTPSGDAKALVPGLRRIIDHCLEKQPSRRFQGANDLAFALDALPTLSTSTVSTAAVLPSRNWGENFRRAALPMALTGLGAVAAFWLLARPRPEPTFLQLTSRKGNLLRARFSPDGAKVYFAATWDGLPTRMFHMAASGGEPTPFGPEFADLLAVGREGQVLLLLKPDAWGSTTSPGTLAILDSGGSEPRPLAPGCLSADLAADGGIAASFLQGTATSRIEWPLGTRRLEHGGTLRDLRFSPDGHRLAYFIRDGRGDTLAVMDARGGVTELLTTAQGTDSLCWTKNGKALLTSLRDHPEANTIALISVDLKGKTRILRTDSTLSVVQDLSSDGRLLWERDLGGSEAAFAGQGLPDLRMPDAVGCITGPFSPDGERFLLVQGSDKGSLTERTTLVREVRRGSTVSLGKVVGLDFSPDSRQVLALDSTKQSLLRIPLGMGLPVPVAVPPAWSRASLASAQFGASGEEVLVLNRAPDGTPNLESLDLRTGATRVLLQGAGAAGILKLARHPSDPSRFTVQQASGVLAALDLRSGESHPLGTTLADHERLVAWGSDGGLVVRQTGTTEISLQRLDPATGARRDWRTIRPADPSGIVRMDGLNFSPDLRSWTFDFVRATDSNLFTVKGLP